MEDDIRTYRDQLFRGGSDGEIAGDDLDRKSALFGLGRHSHVVQRQAGDVGVPQTAVAQQALDQFPADHAGGAQNQDVQEPTPFLFLSAGQYIHSFTAPVIADT